MRLLISRFDPSRDETLWKQPYEITERPDWSVLDALNHIADEVDPREGWWWGHGRNRSYVLFGLASVAVLAEALVILAGVWSLGGGEAAWDRYVAALRGPALRAFHLAALPAFVWYGGRFLRLFPKTQPPRIEIGFLPEAWRRRPPLPLLARVTFAVWVLGSALVLVLLGGSLP
jgi:fumarate reductase subunit C